MQGTQNQQAHFNHTIMNSNGYGYYGLLASGGSFIWVGGGGGNNAGADFFISTTIPNAFISGFDFEQSGRLLQFATAPNAFPVPITITNGRWAQNALNADNYVVLYYGVGPLNIIGLEIDGGDNSQLPKFKTYPNTGPSSATAIGNRIYVGSGTTTYDPFVSGAADGLGLWGKLGNALINSTGFPSIKIPDQFYTGESQTPSITACGTGSPSVTAVSSQLAGQFTLGTGSPTACTITFKVSYPTAAFCSVAPASNYTGTYYISAQSASAFTITLGTGTSSATFNYTCGGN
jgi:hypothetical protein